MTEDQEQSKAEKPLKHKYLPLIAGIFLASLIPIFIVALCFAVINQNSDGSCDVCSSRLDSKVLPMHYDLHLDPDINNGSFTGTVKIKINVTNKRTEKLRLHVKNLEILATKLFKDSKQLKLKKTYEHEPDEFFVIVPLKPIKSGTYEIEISYRGSLTNGIVGFYRASYYDQEAEESKYVVSSKFQPTYARRAFPCFDEPTFKSTFNISIVKPSELVALSNMPQEREELNTPREGFTTVHFQKSVPMVTYLVTFSIGDFAYKASTSKRNVPVRIYATSSMVNHTEFADSITSKILDFYEDYFDIDYPLPKLDIIGIPDFVSGAMEHWGLISFREANLLCQDGVASPANRQRVATVIAHELAHMWFGNLVTMKWWNDLWLNEGFASYMEYKGVEHVRPEWDMKSQFVGDDLTRVLKLDAQDSSHPIVNDVSNPDQITEIFDTISYSKGASVIRMLEHFLGEENFKNGVRSFLKAHKFAHAVTNDLFEKLNVLTPQLNITLIMDTWTRQMGYPVLTFSVDKNDTGSYLRVSQSRFRESQLNKKYLASESPFQYRWEIPLSIQYETNSSVSVNETVWLPHERRLSTFKIKGDINWIKMNRGQFGYYRVHYSRDMLKEIHSIFQSKFTPEERCGLLDDTLSLARSGHTKYSDALYFTQTLANESHYVPWKCVEGHLLNIGNLLSYASPHTYFSYRAFMRKILNGTYQLLDWKKDSSHLSSLLKPKILSLGCKYELANATVSTNNWFKQWIKDEGKKLPVPLRSAIYSCGMQNAGEFEWNIVWKRYLNETDAQERVRLLLSLSSITQPWILKKLISLSKNETLVKRQDFFSLMRFISKNTVGNPLVWNFYSDEYEYLVERFTLNDRSFGNMVYKIAKDFYTERELEKVKAFFNKYPEAGAGKRARTRTVERIAQNINWVKKNVDDIKRFLQKF